MLAKATFNFLTKPINACLCLDQSLITLLQEIFSPNSCLQYKAVAWHMTKSAKAWLVSCYSTLKRKYMPKHVFKHVCFWFRFIRDVRSITVVFVERALTYAIVIFFFKWASVLMRKVLVQSCYKFFCRSVTLWVLVLDDWFFHYYQRHRRLARVTCLPIFFLTWASSIESYIVFC